MAYIRPDEFGYASYDNLSRLLAKSTYSDQSAIYPVGGYDATNTLEPNASTHPQLFSAFSGRVQQGAIAVSCAVPLVPPKMFFGGGGYTIGITKGFNYYEPGIQLINSLPDIFAGNLMQSTRNYVNGLSAIKQAAHITCYASAEQSSLIAESYGGIVTNTNQQVVMSDELVPLYIQPTSSGERVRTGTTRQIANITTDTTTISLSPNIIFDKPYDEPPLIFILPGSVPCALWTMNKDTNGKFVSATVVGGYSYNTSTLKADVWEGGTFSYVIAANEIPTLFDDNPSAYVDQDYGMQFFNENGDVTYDSRYETCYAGALNANLTTNAAWKYIQPRNPTLFANKIVFGKANLFTRKKFSGIALNSTNSYTGFTWSCYQSLTVDQMGAYNGTQIMLGVYTDGVDMLNMSPTSYLRGNAITAMGINANFNDWRREAIVAYLTDEYYQTERRLDFRGLVTYQAKAGAIKSPENKLVLKPVTARQITTKSRVFTISKKLSITPLQVIDTSVNGFAINVAPKSGQLETDNGGNDTNVRFSSFINIGLSGLNQYDVLYRAYDDELSREFVDAEIEAEKQNLEMTFSNPYIYWTADANIGDGLSSSMTIALSGMKITTGAKLRP